MVRFVRNCLTSLALLACLAAGAAFAAVDVRVEGRPSSEPIQVFVRVTNDQGAPITNLTFMDFEIAIDGVAEVLTGNQFTQPQEVDPNQNVSVVFVMDYTSSVTNQFLAEMQNAVIDFITAMEPGDMAAIIKFNNDSGAQVIQPFTEIDDNEINGNDKLLIDAVESAYPGDGSNILDAANLGVQQFNGVSLPAGPKAVILVTDGRDSHSDSNRSDVIESANDASIPIFTIGIGNPMVRGLETLTALADQTGGLYIDATGGGDIGAAYESVRLLLTGEYLIEIPNGITDCATHQLTVTVQGQTEPVTTPFTRRTCNTTPNNFTFASQTNVTPGAVVTSSIATITGIEAPAHISVINGSYSIGCTAVFTTDPGTIANGEQVCVQQTASSQPSKSRTTTLTVGGLAVTFTTTTRAQSGGGGGGGGASGLLELMLLGFGGLWLARRRLA